MHDRNGRLLQVGDRVNVPCIVTFVSSNDGYCNTTLDTVEPMWPGDGKTSIIVNAKQCEKVPELSLDEANEETAEQSHQKHDG